MQTAAMNKVIVRTTAAQYSTNKKRSKSSQSKKSDNQFFIAGRSSLRITKKAQSKRCEAQSNGTIEQAKKTNAKEQKFALLFDCDGVLVETEELHRLAYNESFAYFGLEINKGERMEWKPEYYDVLANTVGGGKPKMRWHFKENKWPVVTKFKDEYGQDEVLDEKKQDALVDALQDKKTEYYKKIVEEVAQARAGILELMDEAIANPLIAVGICSAATKAGFEKVVNSVVGKERLSKLDVLMAGDDVTKKKPDPLIYNLAREKIDLPAEMCVVIEDSIVGLKAAVGAGMPCVITPCGSTMGQDFIGQGAKFVCNTTVKESGVTLKKIFPDGCERPNFDF
jgi:HAD superfamily hydrolase (TIGR01509 family)